MLASAALLSTESDSTETTSRNTDDAASTAEMQSQDLPSTAVDEAKSQQYPSSLVDTGNLPIEVDEMESDDQSPLHTFQPHSFLHTPDESHSDRVAFFAECAQALLERHGLSTTLPIHERLDPSRPNRVSKARKPQKPKMVLRCRDCGKPRRGHTDTCSDCKKDECQPCPTAESSSSSSASRQIAEQEKQKGIEQNIEADCGQEGSTIEPHHRQPPQQTQCFIMPQPLAAAEGQRDNADSTPCPQDDTVRAELLTSALAANRDQLGTPSLARAGIAGVQVSTLDSSSRILGGAFIPRPNRNLTRVHREIRVRVKHKCEQCHTTFTADDTCRECGHRRCANCICDLPTSRHVRRSHLVPQPALVPDQNMPGPSQEHGASAPFSLL